MTHRVNVLFAVIVIPWLEGAGRHTDKENRPDIFVLWFTQCLERLVAAVTWDMGRPGFAWF